MDDYLAPPQHTQQPHFRMATADGALSSLPVSFTSKPNLGTRPHMDGRSFLITHNPFAVRTFQNQEGQRVVAMFVTGIHANQPPHVYAIYIYILFNICFPHTKSKRLNNKAENPWESLFLRLLGSA